MAEPVMKGKVEQRNINTIVAPIIDSYNKSEKNKMKNINMKLTKVIKYIIPSCCILAVFILSCCNNTKQENILDYAFNKYGSPIAINVLNIHNDMTLYEYQSEKLYSVLKSPNDTIYVSEIVFKSENNKCIIWVTMEHDTLVFIDKLEYNYHTIQY